MTGSLKSVAGPVDVPSRFIGGVHESHVEEGETVHGDEGATDCLQRHALSEGKTNTGQRGTEVGTRRQRVKALKLG